jgi:uncharacterized membrane protein
LSFHASVEFVARALEAVGVLVIIGGIVWSVVVFYREEHFRDRTSAFDYLRRALGRSVLLGLDFLVAADIVNTVSTESTFESLGILGLLILIRTFLSIEIEMELDGRWPWQKARAQDASRE